MLTINNSEPALRIPLTICDYVYSQIVISLVPVYNDNDDGDDEDEGNDNDDDYDDADEITIM